MNIEILFDLKKVSCRVPILVFVNVNAVQICLTSNDKDRICNLKKAYNRIENNWLEN